MMPFFVDMKRMTVSKEKENVKIDVKKEKVLHMST